MSDFTYESIDRNVPLETYEWDNIWIEHADEPDRTRVLYIGDSISVNNKRPATLYTDSKILFDNYGTSKALDNPYFAETIHLVANRRGNALPFCLITVCTAFILMTIANIVHTMKK